MLLTATLVPLAFVKLPESIIRWARRMQCGKDQMGKQSKDLHLKGIIDPYFLPFFVPVCGFVMIYSFLPHKEIRFIFPAIPMFNACAAYGMSRLHQVAFAESNGDEVGSKKTGLENTKPHWVAKGMYLCGLGAIACTMLGNLVFVRLSKENYPGGVALERLKVHLETSIPLQPLEDRKRQSPKWEDVLVHIDVAAAMTGVSLFGQRHASHRRLHKNGDAFEGTFGIEKSGYEKENSIRGSMVYTHLLTEEQSKDGYHVIDAIPGYPRLDMRNFQIATRDAIFIMEKDGW
mmetsp:Transcript_8559/g.18517  ORF Transcript_8559/g.18517 Transcript_8559/m.18517 type:complete len:289 (-) Transcript_8559:25-891(-)